MPYRSDTLVIILAGGQGERLYPLTRDRAKPAVPFAGQYRIIDFTLSNCINSGLRKIYVLTQYKSLSLDRHLTLCWQVFNYELGEFILSLPAQQRLGEVWYKGTADAIFQNIYTLQQERPKRVLILAGDHIYKMDYRKMLAYHIDKRANLTVGCVPVRSENARQLGVAEVDEDNRIVAFHEKVPSPPQVPGRTGWSLASMGIYVFDTDVLVRRVVEDAKRDTAHDFGKNIIPSMVENDRVFAFHFRSPPPEENTYWRDVGTLDAYWEANIDLLKPVPPLNLREGTWLIRTYQEQRPPALVEDGVEVLERSFIGAGSLVRGKKISRSILSADVHVEEGAVVEGCILFKGVRVGRGARLRRVIVDRDVSIPSEFEIGFDEAKDQTHFTITEKGITVVPRGMIL